MWVPMSSEARQAVDLLLERNPVIGEVPLFPKSEGGRGRRSKAWTRFYASDLHERLNERPVTGIPARSVEVAWGTSSGSAARRSAVMSIGCRGTRRISSLASTRTAGSGRRNGSTCP